MRRLLISAAILALAAGVFALPAATASAAPMPAHAPSGVALVNAVMFWCPGGFVRSGRGDLNPQPLPPGWSHLANAANLNPPPGRWWPPPNRCGPYPKAAR